MKESTISTYLKDGVMDLNDHRYVWNTNIPQPENNVLLRLSYKRSDDRLEDIKTLFSPQNNRESYFSIGFSEDFFSYTIKQDSEESSASINGENLLTGTDFINVDFYFTKHKFYVYVNGKLYQKFAQRCDLAYFSGQKYTVNYLDASNPGGIIKVFEVFVDIEQNQLNCIIQGNKARVCKNNEIFTQGHCVDCHRASSTLYDVDIQANGIYNIVSESYQFELEAFNIYQPDCVKGQIKDSQGNEISYEGSIVNPSFSYNQDQVQNLCENQEDGQNLCRFVYSLQIENSIRLNYNILSTLSWTTVVSKNASYAGELLQSQQQYYQQQKLQDFEFKPGVVLEKEYNFTSHVKTDAKIVFYTTPTFKFPLGNNLYSYGNDIFAQVQVDKNILESGYHLEYVAATEFQSYISPYDIQYSDEGYLNLSFGSFGGYRGSATYPVHIKFKLVPDNDGEVTSSQQEITLEIIENLTTNKDQNKQFLSRNE